MSLLRPNLVPDHLQNVVSVLKDHGFSTVTEFLIHDEEEILKKIYEKVKDLICLKKELHKKFSATVENGFDLYQGFERKIISTGSERLDELLEGGIQEGELTEICGGIATGKTQGWT
ncbi:hypothetical protein LOTGIDRAFT_153022 [Lottia gigantea]|uniref:RecA family profile 1 domain-containing protein n=1 Tax=Lottia gigantea TaxID=225164 RepID=V4C882_LOTGI|nr:hypothetical protein LOTGIDRAFT_153022 [Lottia gigantea]ESO97914.1 hypothetical protein LOTGIDRAFT_153022 [Lottia gigantea]